MRSAPTGGPQVYSQRIDDTIAALKSKGVPVFWVGLPSIRGTNSTADAVYLNDLYRARAERAGIVYIDVWDGFVDEAGKYSNYGPDYEGQIRRLRSGDGVYFTKYGARKLAHYVEREIRRYMSNRAVVALPSGPIGPLPGAGKSAVRPLAGPVVPLTVTPENADGAAAAPARGRARRRHRHRGAGQGRAGQRAARPRRRFRLAARQRRQQAAATDGSAEAGRGAGGGHGQCRTHGDGALARRSAGPGRCRQTGPAAGNAAGRGQAPAEPKRVPAEAKALAEPNEPNEPKREPVEAKKPAARKRPPAEQTAQTKTEKSRLLPPAPIKPRPTQQPARRRSDPLFGPGGPFGWLR